MRNALPAPVTLFPYFFPLPVHMRRVSLYQQESFLTRQPIQIFTDSEGCRAAKYSMFVWKRPLV